MSTFTITNNYLLAVVGRDEVPEVVTRFRRIIHKVSLISITDPDRENIQIDTSVFKDVLEIKFWDLEAPFGDYQIITKEQGKTIKDFINENEVFLVHCEAGISRSAGVAKAIECLKGFSGDTYLYSTTNSQDSIRNHVRYYPNNIVYNAVIGE